MSTQDTKRLVVLGGGESGTGAAILGKDKGWQVLLSDYGTISDKYRNILDSEGIEWEDGRHTLERILEADLVVKSPGIPPTAPVMQAIKAKGIPVVSEIELAGRYTDAKMVCITGSNGKTTTTLLTYHILQAAGIDAGLAGNVGRSLALQVSREPHPVYVIELSSFQLENMYDFKADIAVILNITPDHLDRYDYKMQGYIDAKFRILQNMGPDDYFVYWHDDPVIKEQLETHYTISDAARVGLTPHPTEGIVPTPLTARLMPVSEEYRAGDAAMIVDGQLVVNTPVESFQMPRSELSLSGLHNLYNSMAAAVSTAVLGVDPAVIRRSLGDFKGVEHRLERVDTIDGVLYINDSKATNVNSTWYALESMTRPTVLILGGKDKGNDYSEILPLVQQKVKGIVAMGKDNNKIVEYFSPYISNIADTHSLADAITAAAAMATAGDVVLLSPCCASFDLFTSYEDRGRKFKEAVHGLKQD